MGYERDSVVGEFRMLVRLVSSEGRDGDVEVGDVEENETPHCIDLNVA